MIEFTVRQDGDYFEVEVKGILEEPRRFHCDALPPGIAETLAWLKLRGVGNSDPSGEQLSDTTWRVLR